MISTSRREFYIPSCPQVGINLNGVLKLSFLLGILFLCAKFTYTIICIYYTLYNIRLGISYIYHLYVI